MNVRPLVVFLFLTALPIFAGEETGSPHQAPPETAAPATPAPPIIEAPRPEAPAENSAVIPTAPTLAEQIASLLRIGATKMDQKDWSSAETAFNEVLRLRATDDDDLTALLGLARTYRYEGSLTKACAVYERIVTDFDKADCLPTVYLELGRTLRALGAYKLALDRFYSVINSTLKVPDQGADRYRQLARTAQFEIAETYFQSGDYAEAYRFYSRLNLLDLTPTDRARVAFKAAYSLTLSGDHEKAVVALQAFLSTKPTDASAAEARYLLSTELRKLGRNQEALATALDLLRIERDRTAGEPQTWAYWQRKTGNQLANDFYEQGDTTSALAIYQGLLALDTAPAWRLPVLYQIGLCQERMGQTTDARKSYQTILDTLGQSTGDSAKSPALDDLAGMAEWRLKSLDWRESTDRQLSNFLRPAHPPGDPAAPPPSS